jgi:hypothetical protein
MILPNYQPAKWWECDLFYVSRAGYLTEYEIKLSRADFKKDGQKSKRHFKSNYTDSGNYDGYEEWTTTKYGRLAASDTDGPSRFYYVTPIGLLTADEIPEWAGWIEVENRSKSGMLWTHRRKEAPQLHKTKVSQDIMAHARSVCYYRYWNLRNGASDASVIGSLEPREAQEEEPAIIAPTSEPTPKDALLSLFGGEDG